MNTKKFLQLIVVTVLLLSAFVPTGGASASASQCPTYYTVQWGDTLSGIAVNCGTTVHAIRAANPGLGWWVYAGQVLYIPSGDAPPANPPAGLATYVVHLGDTLGKIAARAGTTVYAIMAVNPQITNPNVIYVGQVINMPSGISAPPPPTPPANYPPPKPPTSTPPPPSTDSYSTLKIVYENGLHIRNAPNGTIISSALYKDVLYYRTNSTFTDSKWRVWVEVKLNPPMGGYYTGWIMVKDQLGNYFTSPQIDS